jgi:hypothetical protein
MNPLEAIKEKLKIKPAIEEYKPIAIVLKTDEKIEKLIIPKSQKQVKFDVEKQSDVEKEEGEVSKVIKERIPIKTTIIDERDKGYDREALMKKLAESKLSKVVTKPVIERKEEIKEQIKSIPKQVKKAKKIIEKPKLIIEDDEEPQNIEKEQKQEEITKMEVQVPEIQTKLQDIKPIKLVIEEEKEELPEQIKIEVPKEEKRRTKKVEKGIAVLGPETVVDFGDTAIEKRLPKKSLPIYIRVSSYYMNNREIFINFINSLFEPYKREIEDNRENISCDNIGQTSEKLSLLTHQKIVRDYMNLYTPYRGLLLYHGLGSGKTCSSIAIAEGMKDAKRIIVMTPASLRRNYMEELKKCGDQLYKKNQYWEWVSTETNPEALTVLSSVLNLPQEYIRRNKGAWFINIKKKSNYAELTSNEKKILDEQLEQMISSKYTFINYNGLRTKRLEELTSGFTKNLFDDSVVIIDEAHNLISRIVNKIKKQRSETPQFLSTKLYEYLLSAKNSRIILLTGTPVINYPNEFGILFNILRGYIKTWEIPLDVKTSKKVDKNTLQEMLIGEKTLDYLDYSPSSKLLTITRNPFGFKNKIKKDSGYQGVSNSYKNDKGETVIETEYTTDEDFERKIINILKRNDIEVIPAGIKVTNKKALPDTLELFEGQYIDSVTGKLKNIDGLKRRIIGLSSYFRSAQESLLPKFNKTLGVDYHIIKIPMSDFQFKIYEDARKAERVLESSKNKSKQKTIEGIYKEPTSTYRIFSRLFCNFVMPNRPVPFLSKKRDDEEKEEEKSKDTRELDEIIKEAQKAENAQDINAENEGEVEGDQILDKIGGVTYEEQLKGAISFIENNANDYLTPEALETYSPKYLHILENIKDPSHMGLHLIYSQFRTLEGVGVFSLVLEKNGFTRFKIKKNSLNDSWEIDISEEDLGKPTYALYTGTETAEEKEIIRNIYNSDWNYIPTNIANQLKRMSNNNNMGEIIKVLMITSSGSEGINLRNTRYVHIMEPYWHPVRLEQVIGRARRICSHKDLPKPLQTVEVFVYLMTFSLKQLKSDDAIELKRKDLSKGEPRVPVTSDQLLYEISEIKANLTSQLTDAIKESSFDCYLYSNGNCLNFSDPTNSKFSYVPDYAEQQSDITVATNKEKIEWVGKPITIAGVKYVYRRMNNKLLNIYDLSSYEAALKTPGITPVQIGTLEINEKGEQVFKQLVT